jgi:hypothetical protein
MLLDDSNPDFAIFSRINRIRLPSKGPRYGTSHALLVIDEQEARHFLPFCSSQYSVTEHAKTPAKGNTLFLWRKYGRKTGDIGWIKEREENEPMVVCDLRYPESPES